VIVIVVRPYEGFPEGTAATSRITSYALGLAANGEEVRIILLGPSELDRASSVNTEVRGVHQGIPFEYTSVSTVKSSSFFARQWRAVRSPIVARRRIRELASSHSVDTILLYSRSQLNAWFFQRVSSELDALYAVDLCEMSFSGMPPGAARDARQRRYGRRFLRRFDLVIAISGYLADYAKRYTRRGAEVIVLPIMVDCDEYQTGETPAANPRSVTYVGILNEPKDGVRTLMTAFSQLAADFPDVNLQLVGDSYDPVRASNIPEFRALAEGMGIASRVVFAGQVQRNQIPRYLARASVLVLARPSSQQADAGFPTKIGEYLASGRPVVVTNTSDLAEYLDDGESAYLVPPDDVDAFAAKLRQVLGEPDKAEQVGRAGRGVAERCFHYRVAGRTLAEAFRTHRASIR
jgi:glycosyltransferase involved in cell wall biosynthesis